MDADTARDRAALRSTHESLSAQVARLQWMVQCGLPTMVVFVPLARVVEDDDSETTAYSLYSAIGFFVSARPADLGGSDAHPYAVPGGCLVTIIGLFLILGRAGLASRWRRLGHPAGVGTAGGPGGGRLGVSLRLEFEGSMSGLYRCAKTATVRAGTLNSPVAASCSAAFTTLSLPPACTGCSA